MRYLRTGFWLMLVMLYGCTQGQDIGTDKSVSVFTNVNVIPMDTDRVLQNQMVIVQDGNITEMGPAATIKIPAKAEIIEGNGRYLLPGLTDFHVHLRSTDELVSYLNYGVTTIVNMSGATSGAPDLLRYRRQIKNNQMLGPTLFTTGPTLDGDPPIFAPVSTVVTTPEEARRVVRQQKEEGYDFIKVYNNIKPEVLEAITMAADIHDMPVFGHIPRKGGRDQALQRALGAGIDMIAHGEEYFFTYFYAGVDSMLDQGQVPYRDESHISAAVKMSKEAEVAVTPNLSFVAMTREQLDSLKAVMSDPETKYLHPDVMEMWKKYNPTRRSNLERFDMREQAKFQFLRKFTEALNDAGITLLLGTDSSIPGLFPGKSAHVELQELVKAGLTPYEALVIGTRNPGAFLGKHISSLEPFGEVAPRYRADLILLDENPLEDINNISTIQGVMARGRWLPKSQLRKMREQIAESYKE